MTKSRFVVSIASGFLAGVAVGILFAPYKGSKTRRKLLRAGEDLSEGIKGRFSQLGELIGEKLDSRGVYRHLIRFGRSTTHI
jgi:gas vesicle protein